MGWAGCLSGSVGRDTGVQSCRFPSSPGPLARDPETCGPVSAHAPPPRCPADRRCACYTSGALAASLKLAAPPKLLCKGAEAGSAGEALSGRSFTPKPGSGAGGEDGGGVARNRTGTILHFCLGPKPPSTVRVPGLLRCLCPTSLLCARPSHPPSAPVLVLKRSLASARGLNRASDQHE